jgi:Zn-dependent M28 family amino/carboxypeptidase
MRLLLLIDALLVAVLLLSSADGQTVEEMRAHVEYLSSDDLGGRAPGSKGMDKAIAYVKGEMLDMEAFSQSVRVRNVNCQNTVFVLPGRTDNRMVIGAHLDHIGVGKRGVDRIYNGADDNASGCAMVIAMARQLSEKHLGCTTEFHFYTGEEAGLIGSKAYVKDPLVPLEGYKFMMNLDMVGRLRPHGLIGGPIFPFEPVLEPLYLAYPFAAGITWTSDTEDSDHSSWWTVGVPAAILHTGLHDDYHKTSDEADKINYQGMVDITEYALDMVIRIDRQLQPPVDTVSPYVLR